MSVVACSADSRASSSDSLAPGAPVRRAAVHVEIALDLAPFLGQQHRQQEARPEHLAESGEQAACARSVGMLFGRGRARRSRAAPHLDVPVFDFGQPAIEVLLLRVGLGVGEQAIQIRRIGFVLPVVLEGVEVGSVRPCSGRLRAPVNPSPASP